MNKEKWKAMFRIEQGEVEGLYYIPVIYVIGGILALVLGVTALIIFMLVTNPTQ